jgi:putative aldouronate transport system permease protein
VGRNGLLFSTTDIIETYVYRSLTQNFDIGLGTAAGLYQSVFGMFTVLTANYIVKKLNPEYALF